MANIWLMPPNDRIMVGFLCCPFFLLSLISSYLYFSKDKYCFIIKKVNKCVPDINTVWGSLLIKVRGPNRGNLESKRGRPLSSISINMEIETKANSTPTQQDFKVQAKKEKSQEARVMSRTRDAAGRGVQWYWHLPTPLFFLFSWSESWYTNSLYIKLIRKLLCQQRSI